MGSQGYALLIEHGIETAKAFAEEISKRRDFELVTEPELNILTYRISPFELKQRRQTSDPATRQAIDDELNAINIKVQRLQREAGKSFVSRTTLRLRNGPARVVVVFRCVIMNPMTTLDILGEILDEQEEIYRRCFG
jgi:glutamate decarboxylase